MAKRPKHRAPPLSEADLRGRIQRAQGEGRFQQALELAKSLYKQDPSPPHRELLKQVTLGRAQQLRSQGHARDAATVLENAAGLDSAQAWREQIAQELASAGHVQPALNLLRPFPDSAVLPRVQVRVVDAALGQGKAGRALLPEALQGPFDVVMQAFAQAEAGQDEAARATLQGIGLQSPFLEWKVLLRGLLAYYQGDDVRARENWQRLDADRLPARLAAPLRFTIDPAFRLAQPPATQASLRQQADRLQNSGLVAPLRAVQAALANERQLGQAFRLAETHLAALRRQSPHLVPRLAACFYWAVISAGMPEDINRYERVFGVPADDPHFARLEALALEHRQEMADAHKAWQTYEKDLGALTSTWPPEQEPRVRALIWHHLGSNAASIPDSQEMAQLPAFLRDHPDRPQPLKPSADKCFERSLELAPDRLETHEALLKYWQHKNKPAEILRVGRRLLERFPDHVPTLEALGLLELAEGHAAEGLQLLQKALRHNPLERRLRDQVSHAHLVNARHFVGAGDFEAARREYQSALALSEGRKDTTVLCKWAASEFKAGDADRAEELVRQALSEADSRLHVAYAMLIEVIRLKLAKPLKTRFDRDFKAALAEPPTGAAAAACADLASSHHQAGVNYLGRKTHEKQVLAYIEKALRADLTETQLSAVCKGLAGLESRKLELRAVKLGQQKFPSNPYFYIAEVQHNLDLGPARCPGWQTQELVKKAQELVAALPHDQRRDDFLQIIQNQQAVLAMLNPFGSLMSGGMFGGPLDELFGLDEDDMDEEDSSW